MCTHRKEIINPYTGKKLIVNCGKCPACRQEKAIKRTMRIKNHYDDKLTCAFVTLTYRNECIPYIRSTDLINLDKSFDRNDLLDDDYNFHLPIFRDCEVSYRRKKNKNGIQVYSRKRDYYTHQIGEAIVFYDDLKLDGQNFKFLRKRNDGAIGVCFFKDVQDYIKRVRINLNRKNYGFNKITVFQTSEYGPSTCRPHFHLLVFFPKGFYKEAKNVLSASWSYDDYRRTFNNIEFARDASAYVSSYVNCTNTIPRLFEHCKDLQPKHSFSHYFGFAKADFSPNKVIEKVFDRNLRYDCKSMRNGCINSITSLLPSYVLSTYFPRFKGYCRLTDNEIYRIVAFPETLREYRRKLLLSDEECLSIYTLLKNKQKFFFTYGINSHDYALAYSRAWTVYRSNVLQDFHDNIQSIKDYFFAYDNIKDYYSDYVRNFFLDSQMFHLPSDFHYETDFNKMPSIVLRTRELEQKFYDASKDKKIRSDIFVKTTNFNI